MRAISVALATYNGAAHLGEQLASLVAQTVLPHELVVSDDGSTDATLKIVRDFAATAPFAVHILPQGPRLGFSDNFLRAAEACQGPLIAFCDQDDVWLPHKLQIGRERLERDGSLMSMHLLTMTNDRLQPIGVWDQAIRGDDIHEPLAIDPYLNGWGNTMLFDRRLLELIPRDQRPVHPEQSAPPRKPLSHDTWIYVLAAAMGRISHISKELILYRQHGANAVGVAHARPSWAERLTAPTWRLSERRDYTRRMYELMSQLTARSAGAERERAHAAAQRYGMRLAFFQNRVDVYAGGVITRIQAFQRLLRGETDTPYGRDAKVRDAVFGVLGMSRLLRGDEKAAS